MEQNASKSELDELHARVRELEKKRDDLALKLSSVTASEAALSEEVERLRRAAWPRYSKMEAPIKDAIVSSGTEINRLKGSARYRIGDAIVNAARKPNWRLFLLPFKIWQIARQSTARR